MNVPTSRKNVNERHFSSKDMRKGVINNWNEENDGI